MNPRALVSFLGASRPLSGQLMALSSIVNGSTWMVTLMVILVIRATAFAQAQPPSSPPTVPVLTPDAEAEARAARESARQRAASWNVRVDVLIAAVPQDRALQLLSELQSDDERRVEAAVAQVKELIVKKQAKLLGWPSLTLLDGDRAVTETITEKRYPTEFEPPGPSATSSTAPAPVAAPVKDSKLVDEALNSALSTSFETRNTGVTLEAEAAVLDEGKRVFVSTVPQRVTLLRSETFKAGMKDGRVVDVVQPEFGTEKVTTAVSVRNGGSILIAVHTPDTPVDHLEFFILHAQATRVK